MTRKINQQGLDHIKRWEGLRINAYQDSANVWTIGYGHTSMAGDPYVRPGMVITDIEATHILMRDLRQFEQAVEQAVKVKLNDSQFAALVSFAYNVGVGAFKKSSLLKKLNKGDYDGVPVELMKWVNAGGKRLQGLVNRRSAEGGLWAKGEFVSSNYIKPQPIKDNPLTKPEVIAPILGAASGLTGFASGGGPFQWALALVMVVAAFIGAAYFIRRIKKENT
ncbi:glycoside hydrolase family protein [Bartonella sp. HY329]|uniref:lysozyme n=1 Tax=unclassified Bartonella TaxID=2645622 RepID=UPI0021C6805C|nr:MULTISPECIES: glycoside hydrolase family protein [unclassified Bartonella]UXM95436.1 glycoside hydrolase family protein [Bartonella sp. HY329]UXN09761.1 glycoside hydrolase family protein [Bartonella sp. HY328]